MARGRKKLPANVHRLHGTFRADRHEGEVKVEAILPDPPDNLDEVARKEWRRISKELYRLELLSALDLVTLEMYCSVYSRWVAAEKMVRVEGEVAETPNGYQQQSAWLLVANNCIKQLQSLGAEFGLTPATRARLKMIDLAPKQQDLFTLLDDAASKKAANG